jgi:hypothetical protein
VIAALLALWLARPLLPVAGESAYPAPAEVADRLAQLSEFAAADAPPRLDRAYLSGGDGMVHVELLGSDGRLLAEGTLNRTGSGADLAEDLA